jgi:hypothetical protein
LNLPLPKILKQMVSFAETCADAYVNQYVNPEGHKVVDDPVVYYNCDSNTFGWTSNLAPLDNQSIVIMQLQKGCFRHLENEIEMTRYFIVDSIMIDPDWHFVLDKIS